MPGRKRKRVFQLFKVKHHSGVYIGQSWQLVTHFYAEYLKMKLLFFCTSSGFSGYETLPALGYFLRLASK